VENSYTSYNIEYDTTVPSLIQRKGYPELGVIFITTISKDPILYKPGQKVQRFVEIETTQGMITPRLSALNNSHSEEGHYETFALIFTKGDLVKLARSPQASFMIGFTKFSISDATKRQIMEITKE
jgi:hypothetical protein